MIEAIIGLVGVIVGSIIVVSKEAISTHMERRRSGRYAAMRIVSDLDQFIEVCVDIVYDDGTVMGHPAGRMPSGEAYAAAQVTCPTELTFPDEIDWKIIGSELMYRALALPNRLKQANRYVKFWGQNASLPHMDEYFEARQESYSELGLDALELAKDFRKKFGIPPQQNPSWVPNWNPQALFQETTEKFNDRSKKTSDPNSTALKETP